MNTVTILSNKVDNICKLPIHDLLQAAMTLGILPPKKQIGWTISPDPRMRIGKGKNMQYRCLTPLQQYNWLLNFYIPCVVTPYVQKGIIVPELNKAGLIHVHIVCQDDDIQDRFSLITLQNTVYQTYALKKALAGKLNKQTSIAFNCIHFLDDYTKWLKDYLVKDEECQKHLDYYYFTDDRDFDENKFLLPLNDRQGYDITPDMEISISELDYKINTYELTPEGFKV